MDDVPAVIRSCGLGEWWNTAFRPGDRAAIVEVCPKLLWDHDPQSLLRRRQAEGVLFYILLELEACRDYDWLRVRPILDKLLELAPTRRAVLDRESDYGHVAHAAWRRRDYHPEALDYVAVASQKRVELAPRLKAALKRAGYRGQFQHMGYSMLIRLRLDAGDIEGAKKLSDEAVAAGWNISAAYAVEPTKIWRPRLDARRARRRARRRSTDWMTPFPGL